MRNGSIMELAGGSELLWRGRGRELFCQERLADCDKQRLESLERHFFLALLGGVSVMAWSFVWAMFA